MMNVDNVPGDTPLTGDCHTKLPDGHDKCMKMQVNTKSTSATLLTVNTLPGALHPAYTHEHTTIYMGVYVPDHRNQQAMVLCPKAVCASQRQHATMLPLEAPHLAGRTSVTVHTLRAAQGGHKNNTAGKQHCLIPAPAKPGHMHKKLPAPRSITHTPNQIYNK
jgi:hypothetical protein